nr:sigma-70 family RNA polymerase sigma factor [uncultured Gellertiella sp.]
MAVSIGFWIAAAGFALRIHADADFLARLKGGDPSALRALVERHHAALVGLAQTIVKNRAAAEDIAQETWLSVLANVSRFEERSQLSSWIIAILLNKAKTHARKEGRYTALADEAGDDSAAGVDIPADRFDARGHWREQPASFDGLTPERIVAGRELWKHVRQLIDSLPDGQRAVLIMRDVEGKSAAEVCEALSLTPENQRILLHRARGRLRNQVEARLSGKGA